LSLGADESERLRQLAGQLLATWPGSAHDRMLRHAECELLLASMSLARGNITQAARLLGIARPTLRAKLARLGIERIEHPQGKLLGKPPRGC
jgi:DNA-binding protein Fis